MNERIIRFAVTAITVDQQMILKPISLEDCHPSKASSSVVDGSEVSSELVSGNAAVLVLVDGGEPSDIAITSEAEVSAGGDEGVEPGSELSGGEDTIMVGVVLVEDGVSNSGEVSHVFIYFCIFLIIN